MSKTKIEWSDVTWNPVTGCSAVSAGCDNCYAAKMAKRLQGMGKVKYRNGFGVTEHVAALGEPGEYKSPQKIFVCSMSDFFHPAVSLEFQLAVMMVVEQNHRHIFQFLTKRIEAAVDFDESCRLARLSGLGQENLWIGATVENQDNEYRIPILLAIEAAVRFVSIEPLLGAVEIPVDQMQKLDWVIIGPEAINARAGRECKPEWIREIVMACHEVGTRCFVKAFPMPDGKTSKKIEEWPTWAQVQQFPDE